MEKLIITACICGAEVTKEHNPAVPYTVEEIANEAYSAYKAGASIIHLHVRYDDGTPTQDKARFKECMDAISGDVKNTYGTGCFLLMNTGNKIYQSKNGLVTTIAISLDGEVEYALEGSVFVGGAVIQWIRDGMHLIQDSCDSEYYAQKVPDNGGVYIVPAFTGLGAPYWDMYARGAILGITRGTTQNHIIRAAEESIAYQSADLMWAMEKDTDITISTLKVDGGASRDHFLMQFQSDILNKEVLRPAIRETTALGAAYLAGLATGVWKSREEISHLWSCNQLFEPKMDAAQREKLVRGWHKAVGRSQNWAEHEV